MEETKSEKPLIKIISIVPIELPKIETLRQPSQYVPPQPQPRTQHLSQRAERIAMKRNKLNS